MWYALDSTERTAHQAAGRPFEQQACTDENAQRADARMHIGAYVIQPSHLPAHVTRLKGHGLEQCMDDASAVAAIEPFGKAVYAQ